MPQASGGRSPRTRTRRAIAGAAVSALSLGLLTACGDDSGDGGQTLDVWIMEGTNPNADPFFDDLKAAFRDRTGARLNIEFIQWAEAHDRITTAMAGNELPDVAEIGSTWAAEFGAAGALADLGENIEADGLGDDLVPALEEAATLDGAMYGMPWYAGTRSLMYRADIFAEHGLEPPTTWEELRDVALELKDLEPEMIPFPVMGGGEYSVDSFIWGAGGELAEQNADGEWHSTINEPEAVEGIEFYTDLATEDELSVAAADTWLETDQLESFQNGDAAMVINGNWTAATLLADDPAWEDKLGVVPIPGQESGYSPSFVGGSLLGDFNSDDPDLAWQLIRMMSTGSFARQWADESGYFPGQQSELQAVQEQDDPLVTPFATQMGEAGASVPVTEKYGVIQGEQVIPQMLQSILSGDKSVQDAADDAAAAMDETFGSS
jgi:N,N'-diacetylchitobiose transport system substrate-binding protein